MIGTKEIGGVKLSPTELQIVEKLSSEGVMRPPTIEFGTKSESFVFTPRPGNARLNAANREIYERAMALISAARKGQLLPDAYRIWSPLRLLEAFRDRGYVRSNSEAYAQYQNLARLKVAQLVQTVPGRWQLQLIKTPENEAALNLAIQLLSTGSLAGMEVNQEARLALSMDEKYVHSLVASSKLRERQKQITDPQALFEYEQFVLKLGN